MPAPFRELVNRCLVGDHAAMVELVDRYHNPVFGLCYRMLGQRQDAEDAAQETMVRMLRSLSGWEPTRDFEPWLLAIAGNRCRSMLAVRQRRPALAVLVEATCIVYSLYQPVARNLIEEVLLVLRQIHPEYREVLLLLYEPVLLYEQICASLCRRL